MNTKAVFFDLDGTLLNDEKVMSTTTSDALNSLKENGYSVIIATGRNKNGALLAIQNVKNIDYLITSNGAAIFDGSNFEPIFTNYMSNSLILEICNRLDLENIMFDPFIDGQAYADERNIDFLMNLDVSDSIKAFIMKNRKFVPSVKDFIKQKGCDVEKVTINFKTLSDGTLYLRKETIDIINSFETLSCVTGGSNNVEVTLKDATKGNAISKVCEMLKITPNEAMAFGDSENDLDMITKVGVGIAMSNAEDCVKKAADYITISNNENGVVAALKKYGLI